MYRSRCRAILLLSLFALAVMVTPAYSTSITTYSDSPSWLAATSGVTTDTFTGYAPSNSYTIYSGGIFQNGVEFIGLSGGTTLVGDTSGGPFSWANYGTGDAGFVSGSGGVSITLPSPVTAFGINLFTSPAGSAYTVTTLATPFTVPTVSSPPPTFFGITSDTAFSSVTLQVPSGTTYAIFDNFQFGAAQTVPEAGTFLLIGTGLLAFAIFRYKRRPRA
jgi:hypothetical protein